MDRKSLYNLSKFLRGPLFGFRSIVGTWLVLHSNCIIAPSMSDIFFTYSYYWSTRAVLHKGHELPPFTFHCKSEFTLFLTRDSSKRIYLTVQGTRQDE